MESPTEAAAAPPDPASSRTFSQVVFTDTPQSYPLSTPITCSYTLNAAFQPNSRDWVGIFKVGWSTTKDYHTFVWVESVVDVAGQQSLTRQTVFQEYYLPKDEIEFYQFCYIDSTGQVRGASTPFCFRNQAEQSVESSPEDDLLVITTQEQVDQSVREKAELHKEVDQLMEEIKTLKRAVQKEQEEAAGYKEQNEQKDKEKSQLVEELDQLKEQYENLKVTLQQQKETDQLKEEKTKQEIQEKYNRAVMKINQLKQERDELRGKVDAQSEDISKLNSKVREDEREHLKMTDSIQLVQVDLQSSEKEKERLSAELEKLQTVAQSIDDRNRENQELRRRLSEQEALQNCPNDDLRAQCQTLSSQLQEARAQLAAEREESKHVKRKAEYLDGELQHLKDQLERVAKHMELAEERINKQELQLRQANEMIADKDCIIEEKEKMYRLLSQEKEELCRDHQGLVSDIRELRRVIAELQSAPPASLPADTETPEAENLYQEIDDVADREEEALVCRHCQERFPLITQQELEQHEQSHRVCPFCTMIFDNVEQCVFEDHVYSHEL